MFKPRLTACTIGPGLVFCFSILAAGEPAMNSPSSQTIAFPDPPALSWHKSGETTFCGVLGNLPQLTPPKTDYVKLMGDTALAFRLRWFQGAPGGLARWCPSSPVGEFSEEVDRAGRSIGWKLDCVCRLGQPSARMDDQVPRIRSELALGHAVLGYDERSDVNVIFGYDSARNVLLSRDYFHGDKTIEIAPAKLQPQLFYFAKRQSVRDPSESAKDALQFAVDQWERDGKAEQLKAEPKPQGWYLYGRRAYDQWIADIRNADPARDKELFQPSWWAYDCLVDARRAAADYLAKVAPDFSETARPHLRNAADLYAAFAKEGAQIFYNMDSFLGPWTGMKIEDWTAKVRTCEADRLTRLKDLDTKAVDEIRLALAAK